MTLDSRARSAVADLARTPLDVRLTVEDVRRRDRARTRRGVTGAAAMLVAVVLVAGVIVRGTSAQSTPPTRPTPAPSPSACPSTSGAGSETCTGTGRTRIDLEVPVDVTVGEGFTRMFGIPGARMVFFDDQEPGNAMSTGVVVQEGAVPLWLDPHVTPRVGVAVTTAPDRSAGSTSSSVAHWLATRPYLKVTSVTTTSLDGLPAYQVELTRNSDYSYPYGAFLPVFEGTQTWLETGVAVRLWLVDLPLVGLTLIWTTGGRDPADLDRSRALVESIAFE